MLTWKKLTLGCAKGLLISLNVIFLFIAICMFCFATVDLQTLVEYGDEQVGGYIAGDVVIIVASVLLILLAVIGCVGTVRENEKILYTYIMLLMAYLVMEIIIAIFISIQRIGLKYRISDTLNEIFYNNATGDVGVENDQLLDRLQSHFRCCGVDGPENYAAIHRPIRPSCCLKVPTTRSDAIQKNMYQACINSKAYYYHGCELEILTIINEGSEALFSVAVIGFWLEVAGMLSAFSVANHIKNSVQAYEYTVKY